VAAMTMRTQEDVCGATGQDWFEDIPGSFVGGTFREVILGRIQEEFCPDAPGHNLSRGVALAISPSTISRPMAPLQRWEFSSHK
jgi:hypothetical protein